MFRIDDDNSIKPLMAFSFSELGFKERQHLQEWIAKYPSCLDEDRNHAIATAAYAA